MNLNILKLVCIPFLSFTSFLALSNTLYVGAPGYTQGGEAYTISWGFFPSSPDVEYAYVDVYLSDPVSGNNFQVAGGEQSDSAVITDGLDWEQHQIQLVGCVFLRPNYDLDCSTMTTATVDLIHPNPPSNFIIQTSTSFELGLPFDITGGFNGQTHVEVALKRLNDQGQWVVLDTQVLYVWSSGSTFSYRYTPLEIGRYKASAKGCIYDFCSQSIDTNQITVISDNQQGYTNRRVIFIHSDLLGSPVAETE